jgi:[ribosomal protein S5]-alanine N-acetyltransferase
MERVTLSAASGLADLSGSDRATLAEADEPFLNEVLTVITAQPRADPWGAYLARTADGRVAGLCCFKAEIAGGEAEIAYATLPSFEGRGVARAMVAALIDIARSGGATRLIAHTLPEPNASTRVLSGSGFVNEGEAIDPEDGLVWRWGRGLA